MIFLCLGDSLTAGYPGYVPNYGNYESQYEYWLKLLCDKYYKENKDVVFVNKGVPGELTSDFLSRVQMDLVNYEPKPDYSIIIGGTNDLGWGISNEIILNNIKKLHFISRENGIIPIGATVPPIRSEQDFLNFEYHKQKEALNKLLCEFFKANGIFYADLYSGMSDKSGNLKNLYAFSDGLHFSVEGYKQMGTAIFNEAVKNILENFKK